MSSITNIQFTAENLAKSFFRKNYIFKDISICLEGGDSLAITGKNGAGKSTLMKVFAGFMIASKGKASFGLEGITLKENQVPSRIAFAAPYINLYEEFTPLELAEIYAGLNGKEYDKVNLLALVEKFNLSGNETRVIKNFSSGMKQRVKLILAFLLNPPFLFLDELSTNLDSWGQDIALELALERKANGLITFIASNDPKETEHCNKRIEV